MIRWPRPTVRLRLTLTYTVLFVVTGAALLGASYIVVRTRESGPRTAVQIICAKNGQAQRFVVGTPPAPSSVAALNAQDCSSVVGTFYYHSSGSSSQASGFGSASGGTATSAPNGPLPISAAAAAEVSQVTATVKASQLDILNSFRVAAAIVLGFLTLVALGLSWWMAGRALRPVHRITDAARSLSEQTLHARINLQGPDDELKQLADTFDAMLGRLDRAFHSQRRFVANASHELRTPLATERVLIDEALANPSARPDELRF